jgi:hypothetical protein
MMKAKVYHVTVEDKIFSDEANFPEDFTLVATVTVPEGKPLQQLEFAYERTNTIFNPWRENSEVEYLVTENLTPCCCKEGCRSSSVGDVIEIDDVAYRCASVGWEKINDN